MGYYCDHCDQPLVRDKNSYFVGEDGTRGCVDGKTHSWEGRHF